MIKCEMIPIIQNVRVRKNEVDIKGLQEELRAHKKLTNKEVARILEKPLTKVEHYFRRDKYFVIPDEKIWLKLKKILGIETDKYDKQIMEWEIKESEFEMGNRAYSENGLCPTLTTMGDINILVEENVGDK